MDQQINGMVETIHQLEQENEELKLRLAAFIGNLPSNDEIDLILEQDMLNSKEYKKYSEREKILMMAAAKAGAKWFRSSLIEGSFRE